jgi:Lon protease-like protein
LQIDELRPAQHLRSHSAIVNRQSSIMQIPLFPLPNVVLFPGVYLPLHIFEPRYRAMVVDALDGDRMIGMVLLRPGFEDDYEGRPAVFDVGCAGVITHHERLPDGRFNIVLQGTERFRIADEDHSRPYRIARVESLPDVVDSPPLEVRSVRQRLESLVTVMVERNRGELSIPPSMTDVDVIHALAQYLELAPLEKQALLEMDGLLRRASALADLLEMHSLPSGGSGAMH